MGAKGALPKMWAKVHPRFQTPTNATIWMGILSVAFYVGLKLVSENIYRDALAALGLMIAFCYGLTGDACTISHRHQLLRSVKDFVLIGLLPLLGGIALTLAFVKSAIDLADPADSCSGISWLGVSVPLAITIASFVLGLVLMVAWLLRAPAFFRRHPETAEDDTAPKAPTLRPAAGTGSVGH
jgi:amino acid transporter